MEENEAPLDGNGNSIPQTPVEPTLVKSLEKHKMSFQGNFDSIDENIQI